MKKPYNPNPKLVAHRRRRANKKRGAFYLEVSTQVLRWQEDRKRRMAAAEKEKIKQAANSLFEAPEIDDPSPIPWRDVF